MIDDIHCNKIRSSMTIDHCFHDVYVGTQPAALEKKSAMN